MAAIAMILKRSPYGEINAAEAVRHALGAIAGELSTDLILVDGGVLLAKKGQDDSRTGFTNLEASLKDCLDMGVAVYVDTLSMKAQNMDPEDLMDGAKAVSSKEISVLVKKAKTTMIF